MALMLGLDIGSTSIKANIYDQEGNLISGGSKPTILSYPDKEHPAWAIWHPDDIWNAVKDSINGALDKLNPKSSKSDIKSVAVTGFGMDGVPIDKSGKWLYPFISWQCSRTEKQSLEWSAKVGADKIFSISGKQVMPIDTVYRILWIKENYPEILDKTYKWLLIEDYINYRLCGAIATDYSMASCTSLLDQKTRNWSPELIKSAGFDASILPPIFPSGTILGNVSPEASSQTGLPTTIKVVLGGHDYHCAALAVGAFVPETVMSINGTWEMVLQSSPQPRLEKKVFENGINVESHVVKNTYNTVAYSVAGLMYEWLNKTLCFEEHIEAQKSNISEWEVIKKKAGQAPVGSNGVFFAPYFFGAGSPYVDNRATGAFVGLTNLSDKNSIIRSVIEALNYQFRDMLTALEDASGLPADKIVATGGASQNEFWTQNKADITGKLIEVPASAEATPLGAALVSGIGIGIYKDAKEAYNRTYGISYTCEPDLKNKALYDDYYGIYKSLYPDLKNISNNIYERFRK
jgi:xylulokinase